MRPQELKVSPESDYYVYAPSLLAKKLYLYPLSTGHFIYEPEYYINRNKFDSFLIMYIISGSCNVTTEKQKFTVKAGEFLILDCYVPHCYGSPKAWEALWIHFDGVLARNYFEEIVSHYGNVLLPDNPQYLIHLFDKIRNFFRYSNPIVESALSDYITHILNAFLTLPSENNRTRTYASTITDSISFINEHFNQNISLTEIASKANLSLYHFTRIFSKETGFTPHQYLIHTRISAAKYMLKSSETSIKDIAFSTGFHSESSFCSTFKKWEKMTPSQYRGNILS